MKFLPAFLVIVLCGCSSVQSIGTEQFTISKMNELELGYSTGQVQNIFGYPPHYVTVFQRDGNHYELWEYKLGNYAHSENAQIFFKNGIVAALPPNERELMKVLQWAGLMAPAKFWNNIEKKYE